MKNEISKNIIDKNRERYIVKPVAKALQTLDLVCRSDRPLSLNEIFLQMDIPKPTVMRYLVTLEAMGYISHDKTSGRYRMSLELWRMTRLTGDHQILCEVSLPSMRKLLETYQETINLGVMEGRRITYLNILESDQNLRLQARIGSIHPVHSTALGKAILAQLPDEERNEYLNRLLDKYTDRTITDHQALLDDLRQCREKGYSIEVGENEDGVVCIGSAILDHLRHPVAALSISIPTPRMKDHLYEAMGRSLVEAARDISRKLGN